MKLHRVYNTNSCATTDYDSQSLSWELVQDLSLVDMNIVLMVWSHLQQYYIYIIFQAVFLLPYNQLSLKNTDIFNVKSCQSLGLVC